jgi:hypothetical protein
LGSFFSDYSVNKKLVSVQLLIFLPLHFKATGIRVLINDSKKTTGLFANYYDSPQKFYTTIAAFFQTTIGNFNPGP